MKSLCRPRQGIFYIGVLGHAIYVIITRRRPFHSAVIDIVIHLFQSDGYSRRIYGKVFYLFRSVIVRRRVINSFRSINPGVGGGDIYFLTVLVKVPHRYGLSISLRPCALPETPVTLPYVCTRSPFIFISTSAFRIIISASRFLLT